jgi:hypothetical protein
MFDQYKHTSLFFRLTKKKKVLCWPDQASLWKTMTMLVVGSNDGYDFVLQLKKEKNLSSIEQETLI